MSVIEQQQQQQAQLPITWDEVHSLMIMIRSAASDEKEDGDALCGGCH